MELGPVAGERDVLTRLRWDVDLCAQQVNADRHVLQVGRGVHLGRQVLLDLDQDVGIQGRRRDQNLKELIAHEVHARFGRAQRLVTALLVHADLGAGVGGSVEAHRQHGEEHQIQHGKHRGEGAPAAEARGCHDVSHEDDIRFN